MKTASLEAFGIDPDILNIWQQAGQEELLPIQEEAVKRGKVLEGNNVVIFSPTSSGKTFVGEMAAVRTAQNLRRVIYLAPQKALAEEKYRDFHAKYANFGIRVVISTRDRKESDPAIHRGDFHIAVVVFEKMQSLLVANPALLQNVGLVVVDELQMVGDQTRGAGLEILLTKLILAESKPQIVGLSAVLGNAKELADWLGATLCESRKRPVELRRGVLLNGDFRYIEQNSGDEGTETLSDAPEHSSVLMTHYVAKLVDQGEQCLVFCKSRNETIDAARAITEAIRCEKSTGALAEIDDLEDSEGKDILMNLLQCGIAYHNSDLDWEQRQIVEQWFRKKNIKVVCATTTLAIGINLPSRNVFIDHERWGRDAGGRWIRVPISQAEYENISGRAGRLGLEDNFGRAILIADSSFNEKALFRTFVQGDLGDIEPALDKSPLSQHVLNLVASGLCKKRRELRDVLLESYTGKTHWQANSTAFEESLDEAISDCVHGDLFKEENEILEATAVGKLAAAKGLLVDTAISLVEFLNAHRAVALTLHPLEIIWHLSGTANGECIYFNLSTKESKSSEYPDLMHEHVARMDRNARERMEREFESFSVNYNSCGRLKKALLLYDWISGTPTRDIERTYYCFSGSIYGMAGEYAWLSEAFVGMAKLLEWPDAAIADISTYPGRMIHGVPVEGVRLASLRLRGLARGRIGMLIQKGIASLEQVVQTPVEILTKIVTGNVTKRLIRKSRQIINAEAFADVDLDGAFDEFTGLPSDEVPEWAEEYPLSDDIGAAYKLDVSIEIDGRKDKLRFLTRLNDQDQWLTAKSFEAALILAIAAKTTDLGWAGGHAFGTPDGYHQTIRRLKKDLAQDGIDMDSLVENSKTKEYRFSVPPQRIRIDAEMIRRHSPELDRYLKELEQPAAD